MSARVFIWVQHLLGFGHFARARIVATSLRDAGFSVTLVSGGVTPAEAVPAGLSFVQLPPARAKDELFDDLVDDQGRTVDRRWHEARRDLLLAAFHTARPDALMTETFPFGRRLLDFEMTALIDSALAAAPRPKIIASVRDVLQRPRKDARAVSMVARARQSYDAVFVHGDPQVLRLEQSFSETSALADRLFYTGYICAEMPRSDAERHEVLVSAGGGAAGGDLIACALEARALSQQQHRPWTFVTGPLAQERPTGSDVTIVRSLPDFRARLAGAAVSISQAGYNTLLETVRAGTPSVVVPFETEREKEQSMRATAFAARGLTQMIRARDLSATALARAVDAAVSTRVPDAGIDFGGAEGTVRALRMLLSR